MTQEKEAHITKDTVLDVLRTLHGREAGLRVGELVERITGEESTKQQERRLRQVIAELRMAGHPACATPDDGYFWGVTDGEIWSTVNNLTARSMTGLRQASRMSGCTVQELARRLERQLEGAQA